MKHFRLVDNLMGWLIFAVAAYTYCSTVEPTASFWDCPEFITTGYKLEVGHPPGAPFFMLTANLFSQFVSDPADVAYMVNIMSAVFSALCILFLYWTISHLVRRLICKHEILPGGKMSFEMSSAQLITTQASAVVGSLAYCWSDTFWFSAVEGEVYAYSSLFTALVVWLMLKWEDHADEPHSDRWLILIAYMTGLSVGVHLLNLLCLPALVLIYYYRKYPNANLKGSILALLVSVGLVIVVLYGIVPGIVKVGGWAELLFVNAFGLPFNSGLYVYLLALVGVVIWAIWETYSGKNQDRANVSYLLSIALLGIPFFGHGISSIIIGILLLGVLAYFLWRKEYISARLRSTSLCCLLLMMIGYSSYAVIVIRSSANTPMDQNSPEDIFTLASYLNREQYGDRPLLFGQVYYAEVERDFDGRAVASDSVPIYQRVGDKYEVVEQKRDYKYDKNMLFPRMYSSAHKRQYEQIMGYPKDYDNVTFWDNLKFFFNYQINYMYMRYFMWNFAGRQNDLQGYNAGDHEHGNWISGISFLDNWRLDDQDQMPDELKNNKGHNVYYMLPLLLGLLGMIWQICRSKESVKQFWVVFFLFFMTGLAIVLYLNQTPMQPRERDYAYAGSFYGFAIWIGMGVTAITCALNKVFKKQNLVAAIIPCVCVAVPLQMASQNWDDHNRSGRYTCRDFGQNYLMTLCETGNPIIFTNGDNDTFPLWYNQETEGFRTDARVCNLSYLQTDWYIDQMKRPAYDSPGLPISWSRDDYVTGTNEYVQIYPTLLDNVYDQLKEAGYSEAELKDMLGDNPNELRNIIDRWILHKNEKLNSVLVNGFGLVDSEHPDRPATFIPTTDAVITVDKKAVLKSGMMIPGATDSMSVAEKMALIPDEMEITFNSGALTKSEMMMYEMLIGANWTRPLYVAVTVGSENYGSLGDYFIQEGLAYRITPFKTANTEYRVDTERMYKNLMEKFKFGGIDNPDIYLDETVMRMCKTHRRMYAQLAKQLLNESTMSTGAKAADKKSKAKKLLAKVEEFIPAATVPHSVESGSLDLAEAWLAVDGKAKAAELLSVMIDNSLQYVDWYLAQGNQNFTRSLSDCMYHNSRVLPVLFELLQEADAAKYAEYKAASNKNTAKLIEKGLTCVEIINGLDEDDFKVYYQDALAFIEQVLPLEIGELKSEGIDTKAEEKRFEMLALALYNRLGISPQAMRSMQSGDEEQYYEE